MANKKSRGAQPGNANALKSGFYSRTFSEAELVEIGRLAVAELGLDEEIAMLRVLMRRVLESDMPAARRRWSCSAGLAASYGGWW